MLASSVFGGNVGAYGAHLANDGSLASSWFSDGGPELLRWTGAVEDYIDHIVIYSNANHAVVAFQHDFGFGSVTVEVLDAGGFPTYVASFSLPGGNGAPAYIPIGARGKTINLSFGNGEAADCSGIGELQVVALR
jgi:hypothetical protein